MWASHEQVLLFGERLIGVIVTTPRYTIASVPVSAFALSEGVCVVPGWSRGYLMSPLHTIVLHSPFLINRTMPLPSTSDNLCNVYFYLFCTRVTR
jgi:hypothetical protein